MDANIQERLRKLPKVDAVLAEAGCGPLIAEFGRERAVGALREALDAARDAIMRGANGHAPTCAQIVAAVAARLEAGARPLLRRVINATGIVLHTNLGRAPLSAAAIAAVGEVARGYSNLEYDLGAGERGSRQAHVDALLCRLTGAEAALVVNNNAAAVMLAVNTVARDGDVVTSRGELIEIGGSFRIPDVIETSEARLVETGTTNRTRAADFARAITPKTRALLRVHPSNYRIVGFTESASREELVALAHEHDLVAIEDLGSGTLIDLTRFGLPAEPTVQEAVAAGMDVVTFSGDKLLGGPQAGIAAGSTENIARMKRNPLYRALRVDKMTLAALEATLRAYLDPERIASRLPVMQLLAQPASALETRARKVAAALAERGFEVSICETESFAGGGSLPGDALPDFAVAVRDATRSADELHAALRRGNPAVVARISEGRLLLHMRTATDGDVPHIEAAFAHLGP